MNTRAIPIDPFDVSQEDAGLQDVQTSTWLSAAEAAAYLNFKVRTIHLWARQGRLKGYPLSGTQRHIWRFLRSDLDANRYAQETCGKLGPAVRARYRKETR